MHISKMIKYQGTPIIGCQASENQKNNDMASRPEPARLGPYVLFFLPLTGRPTMSALSSPRGQVAVVDRRVPFVFPRLDSVISVGPAGLQDCKIDVPVPDLAHGHAGIEHLVEQVGVREP